MTVEMKASDLAKKIDLVVTMRVRGYRWWLWRVTLARWVILFAAWLMGAGVSFKAVHEGGLDG